MVTFKILAYTLCHSDIIFIQTILLLLSISPSILAIYLVERTETFRAPAFWVTYLLLLVFISVFGIILLLNITLFDMSLFGLLSPLFITAFAVLFEKKCLKFLNTAENNGWHHSAGKNHGLAYADIPNITPQLPDRLKWSGWAIRNKWQFIRWVLVFSLIGAMEEICYRGIILQSILSNFHGSAKVVLIALQILLFGLNHAFFGYEQIIPKVFFGLMLTLVTISTHALIAAILSHLLFNAWAIYAANKNTF